MTKDAYYFPHDSNANCDPKCMLLIHQLGLEGYGIYWVLIETLREQPDYRCPLALVPVLAERFKTTVKKIEAVIASFDLFVIEDQKFFRSDSLERRMERLNVVRTKRKEIAQNAADARWSKPKRNAQAMHEQCSSIANENGEQCETMPSKVKESIVKESKEEKSKGEESINTLRTHSESLLSYFQLTPGTNPTEASMAAQMVRLLMEAGRLDHFAAQFEAYKTYKAEANEFRHNFKSYVGTFAQGFMDGNWNAENWPEKLRQFRSRTSAQEGTLTDVQKQILEKTKW